MIEKLIIIALVIIIYGLVLDKSGSPTPTIISSPTSSTLPLSQKLVSGVKPDGSIDNIFWDLLQSPTIENNGRTFTEVQPNIYMRNDHNLNETNLKNLQKGK